jgi:RNA polymerase sigma-70 factor (ECF subfamily)
MNATAYNDCVRKLSDALYRFACKCTGDGEAAKDVVQSSFEALWNKRADVPEEKAKAFLFQVTYNQSVNVWRAAERQASAAVAAEDRSTGNVPHGLKAALESALATLDPQSRALVLLKDYEGYSYAEIGRLTDLNESQVKVYLFRARKKLQAFIGKPENVL